MKSILKNKKVGLAVAVMALLGLEYYGVSVAEKKVSSDYVRKKSQAVSSKKMLPDWMPKSWGRELLSQIAKKQLKVGFDEPLSKLNDEILDISWVDSVQKISRDYQGVFNVQIGISRPVCFIKSGSKMGYLDKDKRYMKTLSSKNYTKLEDGTVLPVVDVSRLNSVSESNRKLWMGDLVRFLMRWQKEKEVKGRYDLSGLVMNPYRSKDYISCGLSLNLKDKKFGSKTKVVWGVCQLENALESRTDDEKWTDLNKAIARDKYISALNLRYNVSDSIF